MVSALGWGTHSIAPFSFRGATSRGGFTLLPMLNGRGHEHHVETLREVAGLDNGSLKPVLGPRHFMLYTVIDAHTAVETGTTARPPAESPSPSRRDSRGPAGPGCIGRPC